MWKAGIALGHDRAGQCATWARAAAALPAAANPSCRGDLFACRADFFSQRWAHRKPVGKVRSWKSRHLPRRAPATADWRIGPSLAFSALASASPRAPCSVRPMAIGSLARRRLRRPAAACHQLCMLGRTQRNWPACPSAADETGALGWEHDLVQQTAYRLARPARTRGSSARQRRRRWDGSLARWH